MSYLHDVGERNFATAKTGRSHALSVGRPLDRELRAKRQKRVR